MERTRVMQTRLKKTRRMRRAAAIGMMALLFGGFALFLTKPASTEATAGRDGMRLTDRVRVCMLQDTVQAQAGLEYEHQGKKICAVAAASRRLRPASNSRAPLDPVTGAKVDKATAPMYAYRGNAYFFASEESLATFAQDPQRYITASVH